MAHADVFVGSMSSLSKLAATLAPVQTVRVMPITEGDDPTTSLAGLRGVPNVVELCDDAPEDGEPPERAALEAAVALRAMPARAAPSSEIANCAC